MDPDTLVQHGILSSIDLAFAAMIQRIDGGDDPWVAIAAGLVSRTAADGHVCLDLEAVVRDGFPVADGGRRIPVDISLERWRQALTESSVVGVEGQNYPMILDGNNLYLQRYWNYETSVADSILTRCQSDSAIGGHLEDDAMPDVGMPGEHRDPDQVRAVLAALNSKFTVISGGPGTGKTTTIARIIVALRRMEPNKAPRIMLAAPTGKAAARMHEALVQSMDHVMKGQNPEKQNDPIEAKTLHRLLKIVPGQNSYRYASQRPLAADVIIVDEASMIDLALMAKLIEAAAPHAKLILVGDKDQLSSVEAGSVMGDICAGVSTEKANDASSKHGAGNAAGLSEHIVVLNKNYRFSADSGIDELGRAINSGDSGEVMTLLQEPGKRHIDFRPLTSFSDMEDNLSRLVMEGIAPIFSTEDPLEGMAALGRIKILTPLRKGPFGVETINRMVEAVLRRNRVIVSVPGWGTQWYAGRPVIMNRNDYFHHLFNGDVGITIVERIDGMQQVRVGFADGRGKIRYLAPEQLPDHQTVYAMSVHKSQGTEFQKVVLILPDRDLPLMTRELIYTAVTRARQRVEIWGRQEILSAAVERRLHRVSGLKKKLWPQN